MNKVWIVTSGEYSAYRIDAVYSKKEDAEIFAKMIHEGRVEEYTLNLPEPKAGYKYYEVWMDQWGDSDVYYAGFTESPDEHFNFYDNWAETGNFSGDKSRLVSTVLARDKKHAVKIVNEKRIQYLAEGKWRTKYPA